MTTLNGAPIPEGYDGLIIDRATNKLDECYLAVKLPGSDFGSPSRLVRARSLEAGDVVEVDGMVVHIEGARTLDFRRVREYRPLDNHHERTA